MQFTGSAIATSAASVYTEYLDITTVLPPEYVTELFAHMTTVYSSRSANFA